jgi:hypothetical protein
MLMAAAPAASANNVVPPDLDRAAGSRTITTDNGGWVPPAAGYTYAWYRCTSALPASCTQPIPGATRASYVLRTADIGFRIRSRVTDTGGTGSAFSSNAEGPIAAAPPVNSARPTLRGTERVGFALGTTTGTWSRRLADDPPFRYQWQRCTRPAAASCSNISGATGATHVLSPQDAGRFIRPVIAAEGLGVAFAVPSRFAGPILPAHGRAPRLRPFPVLVITGRVRGATTRLGDFVVRGPRLAKVSVRCKGRACPFRRIRGTIGKRKRLRLRRAQRAFRAGQVLEIRVTGRNRIGKFTRITFRRGRAPRRFDSCLQPAARKPSRCPGA